MPPGSLPLPPRGRRALRPILVVRFILRFLEAMQGRQRFLEISSMPYGHRVGTHKIRTIYINFFFCGNMGVVFVRKSVHLKDYFFRATQLDHSLSEPRITDKSIVNVLVLFLSTPLLELICRVVFFATFFLPVPVTVWPALPDVKVRRHALHCAFGSTSTISHSSVFPAALIASCDFLLKGLNARCC